MKKSVPLQTTTARVIIVLGRREREVRNFAKVGKSGKHLLSSSLASLNHCEYLLQKVSWSVPKICSSGALIFTFAAMKMTAGAYSTAVPVSQAELGQFTNEVLNVYVDLRLSASAAVLNLSL